MMPCSHSEGMNASGTWLVFFFPWFMPFHEHLCFGLSCIQCPYLMRKDGSPLENATHYCSPSISVSVKAFAVDYALTVYAQYYDIIHLQRWCQSVMNPLSLQCKCHAALYKITSMYELCYMQWWWVEAYRGFKSGGKRHLNVFRVV